MAASCTLCLLRMPSKRRISSVQDELDEHVILSCFSLAQKWRNHTPQAAQPSLQLHHRWVWSDLSQSGVRHHPAHLLLVLILIGPAACGDRTLNVALMSDTSKLASFVCVTGAGTSINGTPVPLGC